jgi:hypothetical protein
MVRVVRPRLLFIACCAGLGLVWFSIKGHGDQPPFQAETKVDFNRQVLPILADHCFACHGPDEKQRKADLRLDTREGAFAKLGDDVAIIVPGKASESLLVERILSDEPSKVMPPGKHNKPLTAVQKKVLQDWINQGATWNTHWAWTIPKRATLPAIKQGNWGSTPIDQFILAGLEREGLLPSAQADRATLLRRVTIDLTGLPPTPAEVDAFLADSSRMAFERVVDRLLASPRFGEHQARYWLDLARYGDTHGLHLDNYREIWLYREWVINAFNRNMPYDRFITEQLAGDLLPNATLEQIVATGYNRCHVTTSEGGSIEEEVYVRNVVDQVDTFGTVFLGLTVGCARCHDHKYDPLTMKDYYSLFAFFNNIDGSPLDGNLAQYAPIARVGSPEQLASLARVDQKLADVKAQITAKIATIRYEEPITKHSMPKRQNYIWIDDELPPGGKSSSDGSHNGRWQFITAPAAPVYSGRAAHTRKATGLSQHFVENAEPGLTVGQGDTLFAYVYLDPKDPPQEIMLQWNVGGWKHRAYWGENKIDWGADKTGERMLMGSLPETGRWVRLSVPVTKVGLKAGDVITGWAFTQFGGTVAWDKAGITTKTPQGVTDFTSLAAWLQYQQSLGGAKLPKTIQTNIKVASDKRNDDQRKQLRDYFLEYVNPRTRGKFAEEHRRLESLTKEKRQLDQQIPTTLVSKERKDQRPAYILKRGEYDQRGEAVTRGTPGMFPKLGKDQPRDRLGLARWLLAPEHPLTARVAVNRFWQQLFGNGLVKTTEDVGTQGEPPSHPELLDWLAVEFRESGWDVKRLLKLIVMSATYQQTSKVTPERLAKDPANRLYSRGPRFRLDAEIVRDQALFASGLLVEKLGGPSVKPPQPAGLWEAVGYVTSNTANFTADTGHEKVHRRSLYTFWKRTAPPPQMSALDAPSRESCTARRERTNTPMQALLLLNETQYVECARRLAERAMTEGGATLDTRLQYLVKLVLARPATSKELPVLKETFEAQLAHYTEAPAEAEKLIGIGESKSSPALARPELAAMTMVANVILNLDEAVTKE